MRRRGSPLAARRRRLSWCARRRAARPALENLEGRALLAAARLGISAPVQARVGDLLPITVTALDASSSPVADYTGTIHLTSTDPAAQLPPDYTYVPDDSGSHVFTVRLQTSG